MATKPNIDKLLKTPKYIKLLAHIAGYLREAGLGRIVLTIREKIILETVLRIHWDAIHSLRRFSVNDHFLGVLGNRDNPTEPFEDLAEGIRDVLARIIAVDAHTLHCTVKILQGTQDIQKKDWKVFTVARSTPINRPAEYYPTFHLVGRNSTFAALVGCDDPSNKWLPNAHLCFACNDLTKHDKYECSRENWRRYFWSTVVFPLRYRKIVQQEHRIMGFLTFDSRSTKVFGNIPDIFDFKDRPDEYNQRLLMSAVFHVGGMIADILATTMYLQEERSKGAGE